MVWTQWTFFESREWFFLTQWTFLETIWPFLLNLLTFGEWCEIYFLNLVNILLNHLNIFEISWALFNHREQFFEPPWIFMKSMNIYSNLSTYFLSLWFSEPVYVFSSMVNVMSNRYKFFLTSRTFSKPHWKMFFELWLFF